MIVLALTARTLVILPLSTIYITTDLIVTVFVIPPDIFIEPALPVWLPGGSTNSWFVVKWTLIVLLLWFSCVDIPVHQSTLTMNNLNM